MYIEKLQVIQKFFQAQGSVCITLLIIFSINKQYEYAVAVFLAAFVQWIQLYLWAKPTRVSMTNQWLRGIYRGVAIKFLLLTCAIISLFNLKPEGYYREHSDELFIMALVFLVSYTIPYWYFCFLSGKSKRMLKAK